MEHRWLPITKNKNDLKMKKVHFISTATAVNEWDILRTDVLNDARFKFQHKRQIHRFRKQINSNRLVEVVLHRKSHHSRFELHLSTSQQRIA